jgi:hypothetical protein
MAAKEADPYFKRMWARHAIALDQLAERIERSEAAAREADGPIPPDHDLRRPIDSTTTVADAAVLPERREPNEVSLLKQRLEHARVSRSRSFASSMRNGRATCGVILKPSGGPTEENQS